MGLVAARRCSWHEAAGRIAWAEILLLSGPINWSEVDFACTSNFMRVSYVNCTVDGGRERRRKIRNFMSVTSEIFSRFVAKLRNKVRFGL